MTPRVLTMADEQISENQAIRYRRLAFYAADVERLNEALLGFVKKSGARIALLIDKDGHLVTHQGFEGQIDGAALAALVAGSFASTREVAKQLGESEFNVQFHQGSGQSIHTTLVGDRTLQVAVFDAAAKPGLIQMMTKGLSDKLAVILTEIAERPEDERPEDANIEANFSSEMKDHLDDLFGDM